MKKLLTIVLLLLSIVVKAQTIHIIVFCATNDRKHGTLTGVAYAAKNTKQYFETEFVPNVRRYTGSNVDAKYYYDANFNKSALENVVSSLSTSYNDVILFYYCGHGFNTTSSSRQYPKLSLGGMDDARSKWLEDVYSVLKQKNHRLLVTIAEACNRVYDVSNAKNGRGAFGPHPTYTPKAENYRALFNASGDYLCSSCKREQASYFENDWGYFTDCFISSFDLETSEMTSSPTWDNLLATTKKKTEEVAYQNGDDQNPQWKKEGGQAIVKTPTLTKNVVVSDYTKSKLDVIFNNPTQVGDRIIYKSSASRSGGNGYGALKWKSGGYYFGEFRNGQPKGIGMLISANSIWLGNVEQSGKNGFSFSEYSSYAYDNTGKRISSGAKSVMGYYWQSSLKFVETSKRNYYLGQVDANGFYQGMGLFVWANGEAWFGTWENGQQKQGEYIR